LPLRDHSTQAEKPQNAPEKHPAARAWGYLRVQDMSGGVTAIEGFDYQAIVILELSLEHFERHPGGSVRPEGKDDASLLCVDQSREIFVQVKKPSRSGAGTLTCERWSIAEASKLLEDALAKLSDPNAEQWWVLGDSVDDELAKLVAAGLDAPSRASGAFARALRFLALNRAGIRGKARKRVAQLSTSNDLDEMIRLIGAHLGADQTNAFRNAVSALTIELPFTLARIKIFAEYGSESAVFDRVCQSLTSRYGITAEIARTTLARNLRGFINDVAKQHRSFDQRMKRRTLTSRAPSCCGSSTTPYRSSGPRQSTGRAVDRAPLGEARERIEVVQRSLTDQAKQQLEGKLAIAVAGIWFDGMDGAELAPRYWLATRARLDARRVDAARILGGHRSRRDREDRDLLHPSADLADPDHLARAQRSTRASGEPLGIIGADPMDGNHLKHLHFAIWRGRPSEAVDPQPLMKEDVGAAAVRASSASSKWKKLVSAIQLWDKYITSVEFSATEPPSSPLGNIFEGFPFAPSAISLRPGCCPLEYGAHAEQVSRRHDSLHCRAPSPPLLGSSPAYGDIAQLRRAG
jgi:hypothetical protein